MKRDRFDPAPVLAGLKDFQCRTVERVFKRLYLDDPPGRRFLVADEVGLGKTMVARGIVARVLCSTWDGTSTFLRRTGPGCASGSRNCLIYQYLANRLGRHGSGGRTTDLGNAILHKIASEEKVHDILEQKDALYRRSDFRLTTTSQDIAC